MIEPSASSSGMDEARLVAAVASADDDFFSLVARMQTHNPAAPKAVSSSSGAGADTTNDSPTADASRTTTPTTTTTTHTTTSTTASPSRPTSPLSGVDQLFELLSQGQGQQNDDLDWQRSAMVSPSVNVIASTPAKAAACVGGKGSGSSGGSSSAAASSSRRPSKSSSVASTGNDVDTTVPLDQICSFFAKMTYSESSTSSDASSLTTRGQSIPGVNGDDDDVAEVPGGLVCHSTEWVTGAAGAGAGAGAGGGANLDGGAAAAATTTSSGATAANTDTDDATATPTPHQEVIVSEVDSNLRFYGDYFYNQDHTNFVGKSHALGSVVISLRRETGEHSNHRMYRAIVRSTRTGVARLTINESKVAEQCGSVSVADVLHTVAPAVVQRENCLHHAKVDSKLADRLQLLDGCMGNAPRTYKIGCLSVAQGQTDESPVYNNQTSSPAFLQFLDAIGEKIALKGHSRYAGGLDVKDDRTGTHSYYTQLDDNEIMFHVATLLPYSAEDRQQVARKRHVGNDCVVIVHLEHDAPLFRPNNFVSRFQLVFVVIRSVGTAAVPAYSVTTIRQQEVSPFGEPSQPMMFDAEAVANGMFRQFVLATAINGENACYASGRLLKLLGRTRRAILDDVVDSYLSDIPVVPMKRRRSAAKRVAKLLSSRKKPSRAAIDLTKYGKNAAVRWVKLAGAAGRQDDDVGLILSEDLCIVVDQTTQSTMHQFPVASTAAWYYTGDESRLALTIVFGKHDESITVYCNNSADRHGIVARLQAVVVTAKQWTEVALERPSSHLAWGLLIENRQIVLAANSADGASDAASRAGLQTGDSIHTINGRSIRNMSGPTIDAHLALGSTTLRLVVDVNRNRLATASAATSSSSASSGAVEDDDEDRPRTLFRDEDDDRRPATLFEDADEDRGNGSGGAAAATLEQDGIVLVPVVNASGSEEDRPKTLFEENEDEVVVVTPVRKQAPVPAPRSGSARKQKMPPAVAPRKNRLGINMTGSEDMGDVAVKLAQIAQRPSRAEMQKIDLVGDRTSFVDDSSA